jgi:toxin ParE1/3/4
VSDFDNYLVFYVPHTEGVSIVRVLHAATDWRTLLDLQD